jgi:hypothetical protein
MKSLIFLLLVINLGLRAEPSAIPAPPNFAEQIRESDYVVRADIEKVTQVKLKPDTYSVQCSLKVKNAYKAKSPLSPDLDVAFIIKPRSYGKMLVQAPDKGEYIIFLQEKLVKDSKGNSIKTIVLYDPNPYAFYTFSTKLEKQILDNLR